MVLYNEFEFRGIEQRCSSKGNQYLLLNIEDESGRGHSAYCANVTFANMGLKKGDRVKVTFEYEKHFTKNGEFTRCDVINIQLVK